MVIKKKKKKNIMVWCFIFVCLVLKIKSYLGSNQTICATPHPPPPPPKKKKKKKKKISSGGWGGDALPWHHHIVSVRLGKQCCYLLAINFGGDLNIW
jgi:hypothetical protein